MTWGPGNGRGVGDEISVSLCAYWPVTTPSAVSFRVSLYKVPLNQSRTGPWGGTPKDEEDQARRRSLTPLPYGAHVQVLALVSVGGDAAEDDDDGGGGHSKKSLSVISIEELSSSTASLS